MLQAAIAALHDEADSKGATDWPQILALYGLLLRMTDNPMVVLSHAMVHGPARGLELMRALDADPRLARHHRLDAARARRACPSETTCSRGRRAWPSRCASPRWCAVCPPSQA